jgi:hypothetical protein
MPQDIGNAVTYGAHKERDKFLGILRPGLRIIGMDILDGSIPKRRPMSVFSRIRGKVRTAKIAPNSESSTNLEKTNQPRHVRDIC